MKVTVRNPLADNLAFLFHVRRRKSIFRQASATVRPLGKVNALATSIHPPIQTFRITACTQESPTTATFRISPSDPGARVAVFRAGQYVAVEAEIDGIRISRPFSIASPPDVSYRENYYDITIRSKDDGFFAPWVMENWREGSLVQTSDPQGYFYYEPLRDSKTVVCLAGGSGVTPFRSLIPDLLRHEPEANIVLLYGITSPDEILFRQEWERMAADNPERFRFVPVCSDAAAGWSGERGFLSAELIGSHVSAPQDASFFICGPAPMHEFLTRELDGIDLKPRQVRRENFGGAAPTRASGGAVSISVQVEGSTSVVEVAADPSETVLTALERAGLNPPALCRAGECGWCRSRLLDGSVDSPDHSDHLRAGDRKFGYFHPCSSWPESDLVIRIPRNPKHL
jgi:ferredoxin-NADP reductase